MCGIYGMVALTGTLRWPERADRLGEAVRPRGPDAHHRHTDPAALIGVHRLRVVDPTPAADQPMCRDGAVLAINGEIYNARDLRVRFPNFAFRSRGDAEVLLPLLGAGEPAALSDVVGMYGLAHWTAATRTLILARDPHGEKPLFYAQVGNEVWFASSTDALLHHPQLARALDLEAARQFLHLGVVRAPGSLVRGIRQVPAGCGIVFRAQETHTVHYAPHAVEGPVTEQRIAGALDAAVERQLTADVPVGLFLSGGLDSSLIAHSARRHGSLPTFTVGFPDAGFDERPYAERVARDLDLPLVTVEADTPALLRARDLALDLAEPVADPAVLPTILLAERARQDVTVVLGGEGADELFGGYPTYLGHRMAHRPFIARCALPVARSLGYPSFARQFVEHRHLPLAERHVAWFAGALPTDALVTPCPLHPAPCTLDDALELDRTLWLRERLLVKLDRATMRVALEARLPFLDPEVTALARAVPAHRHVRWRGKRLLRAVARNRLPAYILRRTKRGLSVPVGGLLNGALAADVDRLLTGTRLERPGLARPDAVARLLAEHRAGRDHARALWTLYTFEAWRERHALDG